MECREFVADVLEVTAIPVGEIPPAADQWHVMKTVTEHGTSDTFNAAFTHKAEVRDGDDRLVDYTPQPAGTVTIGLREAFAGGTLVPIMRKTGKAKDDESDSVAGRLHRVTVGCDVDDRDSAVWETLLVLERTPSHLLLTFRDGSCGFVWATEDSCLFTVDRDGSRTSVQFRIEDDMGIQLLT